EIQRWAGLGGEALFDSLLVFENYPIAEALQQGAPEGLVFERVTTQEQTNYPLTLGIGLGETLTVHYSYDRGHFDAADIERIAGHFARLLQGLASDARAAIGELPLLEPEEYRRIVRDWNRTEASYPSECCVHQLIEEQVARTPEAVALVFGEREMPYAELNRRANRLAHRLIELGVGPDVLVGIAVERGFEMVVGLLAILKAGGAYVPLDPEYPRERLAYMIGDSGIGLLLTQRHLQDRLPSADGVQNLFLEPGDDWLENYAQENPANRTAPQNLAYVIYTSGSTGQPKGVGVSHGPLGMHCLAIGEIYAIGAQDCELQFMSFAFDGAHERSLTLLMHGGHLLLRDNTLWTPEQTYAAMHRYKVTIAVFPPIYLQQLAEYADREGNPPAVRIYCFGGDAMPDASFELSKRALRPKHFINGYGPTETVVTPLLWKADSAKCCGAAYAPIGNLVGKRSAYVLDANLSLLSPKMAGELYLGGFGVARGYLNRPSLTAERFIPDPFDGQGGGRLYRSGDLTCYRSDGVIDYLGRLDHQVKIRGFRIELGEIEARLQQHEAVREAVVIDVEGLGGRQLAAYLVPNDSAMLESGERQGALRGELKAYLGAALPDYMVPAHLVFLARLPLTPNGKLDRKALPRPDVSLLQQAYVAPQSEPEQRIAAIWAEVLKVERVGLTDNFFELGGDSIISLQVVSRARQAGIRFTPKDLFQHQTVQGLATVARLGDEDGVQIDQGPVSGETALLPIQRYFFEEAIPERHHWNQSVLLKPSERLVVEPLEAALQRVVEHHDALRLRFIQQEGQWSASFQDREEAELLWQSQVSDIGELEAVCNEAQA
ncbi:amino acid adenylation domain-containing protein, partial [Azotobacter vinelandii]